MASRFQAATLVASPLYPNAIAWSDENLIAVACGHMVTILNPALPFGPRGVITIPTCESYPIGLVKREDLLRGCLMSAALARDRRPSVRSISWSPLGMASNYGCLLAVCTTEGRVKLYRSPYRDFCAEWPEVIDLSDKLYDYLANTNFGESGILDEQTSETGCNDEQANVSPNSFSGNGHKRRRGNSSSCINKDSEIHMDESFGTGSSGEARVRCNSYANVQRKQLMKVIYSKSDKRNKKVRESGSLPQITADQYASRSAMLSSTVVAWSPLLSSSSEINSVSQNDSPHRFSIVAVGGRSGNISIWRITVPQKYSIEHSWNPTSIILLGFIQAHNSWVTAINLALLGSSTNPKVLLASGSSDGSVKIWLTSGEKLLHSTVSQNASFFLLKEVISDDAIPVSVLSMGTPFQAQDKRLLAVGKGSGCFEVWKCDMSSHEFSKVGLSDDHDFIVTGLAWAFEGCLYSCGQDNYVRCWLLRGSSFSEVPFPSSGPCLRSFTDIPDVSHSCLGVAVSPGNLVLAMVRNLDVDQLDHMYEARAHKAIVEFFWIGGQQWDPFASTSLKLAGNPLLGFCEKELVSWESSILWSLKKYENPNKPLVMWDIVAALLSFKKFIPDYVDHILARWFSMTYLGSHVNLRIDEIMMRIGVSFPKVCSRQLHLLNIICRCLALSDLNSDEIDEKVDLREPESTVEVRQSMWIELLCQCERELRERLVGLSFSAFLANTCSQPKDWCRLGLAQMEQWVEINHDNVKDQLKVLKSEVRNHRMRLSFNEYGAEEQCSNCSALVPFISPEIAVCQGPEGSDRNTEKHKLVRCAVSMQICQDSPLWFCKCCNRRALKLAPDTLFTMCRYPQDLKSLEESCMLEEMSKPFCPFCGILLQRLQPDFLLSPSPV